MVAWACSRDTRVPRNSLHHDSVPAGITGQQVPLASDVTAADSVAEAFGAVHLRLLPLLRRRDSALAQIRAHPPSADSIFAAFRAALIDSVSSFHQSCGLGLGVGNWASATEAGSDSLRRFADAHLLRVTWAEGDPYCDVSSRQLIASFGALLSQQMVHFLTLVQNEQEAYLWGDGFLAIPLDSLAERIVSWERFLDAAPEFPFRKEALDAYSLDRDDYMTGDEAFLYPDWDLAPDRKASFERFVRHHGDTQVGRLISDYQHLLERNGNRFGPTIAAFLRQHSVRIFDSKLERAA